jgi:hypothetical protein
MTGRHPGLLALKPEGAGCFDLHAIALVIGANVESVPFFAGNLDQQKIFENLYDFRRFQNVEREFNLFEVVHSVLLNADQIVV